MTNPFKDQRRFMIACGQTVNRLNRDQASLYATLIEEECDELLQTLEHAEKELDALTDLLVVIIGYGFSCGYDMEGAWDEVMDTNFAKIDPTTGKVLKREDGKVLKPEGWVPPDLSKFI